MRIRNTSVIVALAWALPLLAHAHHAMDSATPSTLFQGFVSGLAHPVIGVDHLIFVLAVGVACYCFGRAAATVSVFIGATVAGAEIHYYSATLPYADAFVAASLIAAGVLLLRAKTFMKTRGAIAFFTLAGLVHGYAYGEAIFGAEQTPLIAYLAGFTLIQLALVFGGYMLARFIDRSRGTAGITRGFGGALSVTGAVFLVLALT